MSHLSGSSDSSSDSSSYSSSDSSSDSIILPLPYRLPPLLLLKFSVYSIALLPTNSGLFNSGLCYVTRLPITGKSSCVLLCEGMPVPSPLLLRKLSNTCMPLPLPLLLSFYMSNFSGCMPPIKIRVRVRVRRSLRV